VVSANTTKNRRTSSIRKNKQNNKAKHNDSSYVTHGRMELDSHADTIVLGSNAIILQYTSRECDVSPYADTYQPIVDVPIVTGATAVTSQHTGLTYILVFNEAIWMGDVLDHSLINPNQMRAFGVSVQDNPYADTAMHIAAEQDEFQFPMKADGSVIFFDSRSPTSHELDTCPHIILSSATEWNPRDIQFPSTAHHCEEGQHRMSQINVDVNFDMSTYNFDARSISCVVTDRLIATVNVDGDEAAPDVPMPKTFATSKRHSMVTAQELSERWFIGLAQARETIKVTTLNVTRSAVLPLSRRYQADRVFEKPLLQGEFYTDTMDGRCTLRSMPTRISLQPPSHYTQNQRLGTRCDNL
jgi:hypothetical protein